MRRVDDGVIVGKWWTDLEGPNAFLTATGYCILGTPALQPSIQEGLGHLCVFKHSFGR